MEIEVGRWGGKKYRLKVGNLDGDDEEQTLDEFLQEEDVNR